MSNNKQKIKAEEGMAIVGGIAGGTAVWNATYEPYYGNNPVEILTFGGIKLVATSLGILIGGAIGKTIGRKVDELIEK